MLSKSFRAWCEKVSVSQRKTLGLLAFDPLEPRQLAAHLGVSVCSPLDMDWLDHTSQKILLEEDPESWSAVTIKAEGQYLILFNPQHSQNRVNSSLMHELSHIMIGHEPSRCDVSEDHMLILDSYDTIQEHEADWLSACMLIPKEVIVSLKKNKITYKKVLTKYGVSKAMLQFRINVAGFKFKI